MIDFVGDIFKWDSNDPIDLQRTDQLCSIIKTLQLELHKARIEAYEQILKIFDKNPNRVYRFEWPTAYEWDSELLSECPSVSYRTDLCFTTGPNNYIPHGRFVHDGYVRSIYFEKGEIMVDARYDTIPLCDVLEIELILEALISARDYNKGRYENGFYYTDRK